MKLRAILFSLVLIGCLSASGAAQSSKVVKVKPGEPVFKLKRGTAAKLSVVIEIDHGYHINSNRPNQEFLIPTALKLERLAGVTTSRVVYPKAKMQKFNFSEKPLSVYEGKAVLTFTARGVAAGNHTLKGKLTVQACNDEACLRPQTIDVSIPVEVAN